MARYEIDEPRQLLPRACPFDGALDPLSDVFEADAERFSKQPFVAAEMPIEAAMRGMEISRIKSLMAAPELPLERKRRADARTIRWRVCCLCSEG